jgi:predicted DNA repair protein MutK
MLHWAVASSSCGCDTVDFLIPRTTMAGASLLALLDDIASILDDVAAMTKVATQKTAGVLGDDLALNAQQVSGVNADRELPVVFAVAKGSAVNKVILVPSALLLSAAAPWAVTPLLMCGGAFLCFEGVEKLAEKFLHTDHADAASDDDEHRKLLQALADVSVDMVAVEKKKIAGAVRTDFILSAEIVVIALGSMTEATMAARVLSLVTVGVVMTVGVYGLVAAIVKIDDVGLWLRARGSKVAGTALIAFAPLLMRSLTVLGTLAMFLVGGGILAHGIAPLQSWLSSLTGFVATAASAVVNLAVGVVAGTVVLGAVTAIKRVFSKKH